MPSAVARKRCRTAQLPPALPTAVIAGRVELGRFGVGEEVRWVGDLRATRWTLRWRCGRAHGDGHLTVVPLTSQLAELVVVLHAPGGLRSRLGRSARDLDVWAGEVARTIRDVLEGRPDTGPLDDRVEVGGRTRPLPGATALGGSPDLFGPVPVTQAAPAGVART